jgi:phosphoserine phosphatase
MIVVDFDCTLIKVNSFPRWVFFILTQSLLSGRLSLFWRIAVLLAQRKILGRISHEDFKKQCMLSGFPDDWNRRFAEKCAAFLRQDLYTDIVDFIRTGDTVAVCSAAPQCYLEPFAGFVFREFKDRVFVIGSKIVNGGLVNNCGTEKVKNLRAAFNALSVNTVYTNSYDDMPLAAVAEKTVLVGPCKKERERYLKELRGKVIFFGRPARRANDLLPP